ncbi:MAG TPA: tetratricopeptide repeat protein [Pyrinomonadaceae bacterium]
MRYISPQLVLLLILTTYCAQAQNPNPANNYAQRGIESFERNDFDAAIANFSKAIELNGENLEFCFYFRGIALYRLGKVDDAIADLTKAISLKQHPRFYDDRGNLLAQKGDLDGAIADLNKAIEIEPKYAKAYGDRGVVRLMRGEQADAESDLKKCFELDRRLESQFVAAANRLKQQAALRAEHTKPNDVEVLKFNWSESASQALVTPSSPSISVSSTPVSATGTRVLGSPQEKGEAGPPPIADASGTAPASSSAPTTTIRGVDYKFTASIKNTGNKTIVAVEWAYFFDAKDPHDSLCYVLTSKTNIPPGKEKALTDKVSSHVNPKSGPKIPTAYNRSAFNERVVILRLDYADGTSWQSSSALNSTKKTGPSQ